MIRITQQLVREVIEHNKVVWNDPRWIELNKMDEVKAVNFALRLADDANDLKSIVKEAKLFLEANSTGAQE